MRVLRTTRWGQTSEVWLLSSRSWDGGSYTPCSLTQRFCGHPPQHSHLCSLFSYTVVLWARPYTHTHTHRDTPVFRVCQAGAYKSMCVKTEQAWSFQVIDSRCKVSIPIFLKLNIITISSLSSACWQISRYYSC